MNKHFLEGFEKQAGVLNRVKQLGKAVAGKITSNPASKKLNEVKRMRGLRDFAGKASKRADDGTPIYNDIKRQATTRSEYWKDVQNFSHNNAKKELAKPIK